VESHSSAQQAKEIALRALQNIPHSARLYMQLGVEEEASGDLASAKQHYGRSIELNPSIAESHYLLGDVLYREGNDYPRATKFLQQAIDLAPDFTDAYLRMGSALIAMEKYSDAEITLNRAVKTAPDDSRLYARLITCYRKEGQQEKLQEAVATLSRLQRQDEGGMVPQERAFP
jgi:tetratricopeptide (TPR) repeat protein